MWAPSIQEVLFLENKTVCDVMQWESKYWTSRAIEQLQTDTYLITGQVVECYKKDCCMYIQWGSETGHVNTKTIQFPDKLSSGI